MFRTGDPLPKRMAAEAVSGTRRLSIHRGMDGKFPTMLAKKRQKDRTKMPDREPLCRTFRLFSRIDWCKMRRTDHPNLQLSSTTIRFWSGLPRHVPASAHDWGQVLTFQ